MDTSKLNKNINKEQQFKRQQEEQNHRNLVEEKIFGKEIARKRCEAEAHFQVAMNKVSTLVEAKKAEVKRPDTMRMLKHLEAWAKSNPDAFWDKVREEMQFAGAVGIQDLFGLAQNNTILDNAFQNSIKGLHEYGMTLSAPLTTLGTDIFYHINHNDMDKADKLIEQLKLWEPEGWKEYEREQHQESTKSMEAN